MSEYAWFFCFWGLLLALGFVEHKFADPQVPLSRLARWPVNVGFGLVNGLVASMLPVGTVLAAKWATANEIGLMHALPMPTWLLAITTIGLRSLFQYIFHWLAHRIPALWFVHRVHHSDTMMDGSTGLRFHPLELLATLAFLVPLTVGFGFDATSLVVYETVEIVVGIATHASVAFSPGVDRLVRIVFVTPGLHRLHHSSELAEADTNFGTVFSVWDRLFGTYLDTAKTGRMPFPCGVKGVDHQRAVDFGWLLVWPLTGRTHQVSDDER